jgi:hypothetical protein
LSRRRGSQPCKDDAVDGSSAQIGDIRRRLGELIKSTLSGR